MFKSQSGDRPGRRPLPTLLGVIVTAAVALLAAVGVAIAQNQGGQQQQNQPNQQQNQQNQQQQNQQQFGQQQQGQQQLGQQQQGQGSPQLQRAAERLRRLRQQLAQAAQRLEQIEQAQMGQLSVSERQLIRSVFRQIQFLDLQARQIFQQVQLLQPGGGIIGDLNAGDQGQGNITPGQQGTQQGGNDLGDGGPGNDDLPAPGNNQGNDQGLGNDDQGLDGDQGGFGN